MCPIGKHKEIDPIRSGLKSHLNSQEMTKSTQSVEKTLFQGSISLLKSKSSELNFEYKVNTLNPVKYIQNMDKTEFSTKSCQDVMITIGNIQICCSAAQNFTITTNGGKSVPPKFKFEDINKENFINHNTNGLFLNPIRKTHQGTMTEIIHTGSKTATASKSCQTPWVLCSVRKYRPILKNTPKIENISTSTTPTRVTLEDNSANTATESKSNEVPAEQVSCQQSETMSLKNHSNNKKMDCAVQCWSVGRPGSTKGSWNQVPLENEMGPFELEESMDYELMDLDVMESTLYPGSNLLRPFKTTPSKVSHQRNTDESQSGLSPANLTNPVNPESPNSSGKSGCSLDKSPTTSSASTLSPKGPNYVSCLEFIELENSESTSTVDIGSLGLISANQRCQIPENKSGVLKRLSGNTGLLKKKTKKVREDDISRLIAFELESNRKTEIQSSPNLLEMLNVEKYKPRKICLYCNKIYSYYYFPKHMKKSHGNEMESSEFLECPVCKNMIEGNRVDLNLHLTLAHEKGLKYYCDNCGERFKDIQQVREHMADMHKENFIKCPVCQEKSFPCKRSLSSHLRTKHKKIKCIICGKNTFVKDEDQENQKCNPPCRRPQPQPFKNRTRRPKQESEPESVK